VSVEVLAPRWRPPEVASRSSSPPSLNGDLAAIPIRFSAKNDGAEMAMDGVNVLRVAGGRIVEMWLFSAEQDVLEFWRIAWSEDLDAAR
jgi:hypothetical protein